MLRARRLWVTSATSSTPKPASATWSTSRAISTGSTRPCGHHQRKPAAVAVPGCAKRPTRCLGSHWVAADAPPGAAAADDDAAATNPAAAAEAPIRVRRVRWVAPGVEVELVRCWSMGVSLEVWVRRCGHVGRPRPSPRPGRGSWRRTSWVSRTRARMAARSGRSAPRARAWTRALPSAAASPGPASTGTPRASAVSWQSRWLWEPPPTTWTTSRLRAASRAAVRR